MEEKFYIYVGNAYGSFEEQDRNGNSVKNADGTPKMRNFANMFVVSPCSTYESDTFHAEGYKAEKLGCLSPEVWKNLVPGESSTLFHRQEESCTCNISWQDDRAEPVVRVYALCGAG